VTEPFRQSSSSELSDALPRTRIAADEHDDQAEHLDYVDYGDGIRTPPAEGAPVADDYVDYGDGIRTPPGSEPAPTDDYVDFGDGIRTPATPSDPAEPDLRGESIELADGVSLGGTTPIHTLRAEDADGAFGAGASSEGADAPVPIADAFGSGATSPDATPDTGAWPGDAPAMSPMGGDGDGVDPLAATDPATAFETADPFEAADAFEAGDAHAVGIEEADVPDDTGDGFEALDA
jgi:hypothetical protein